MNYFSLESELEFCHLGHGQVQAWKVESGQVKSSACRLNAYVSYVCCVCVYVCMYTRFVLDDRSTTYIRSTYK